MQLYWCKATAHTCWQLERDPKASMFNSFGFLQEAELPQVFLHLSACKGSWRIIILPCIFCLDFFFSLIKIFPWRPKVHSFAKYNQASVSIFLKDAHSQNAFLTLKCQWNYLNQFHLYWQKKPQQDANIHLHANDILQLVITKTWSILVHGKRKEMVCVPVFCGWQKGEPIQKSPYKPEQKRAFIFFQTEKSLHINCRTEVQFLCQYQMNPACQCRRKFTGQYKRTFLWITLQKRCLDCPKSKCFFSQISPEESLPMEKNLHKKSLVAAVEEKEWQNQSFQI